MLSSFGLWNGINLIVSGLVRNIFEGLEMSGFRVMNERLCMMGYVICVYVLEVSQFYEQTYDLCSKTIQVFFKKEIKLQ